MSSEIESICVYYTQSLPDNCYESETVALQDILSHKGFLERLVMDFFKLDSEGIVARYENGEFSELFQPMSMATYCLWSALNVEVLFSEGHFFFETLDVSVLMSSFDGLMRLRSIYTSESEVNFCESSIRLMDVGEKGIGYFHMLSPNFQVPSDAEVVLDYVIPIHSWLEQTLRIAERYIAVINYASELMTKLNPQYQFLAETSGICSECQEILPTAIAKCQKLH